MTLWLVRAGRFGEREEFALQNHVVAIGWEDLSDLSNLKSKDELASLLRETYTGEKEGTLTSWARQLWWFMLEIKVGDLVAMPSKRRSVISIGRVVGEYRYSKDNPENSRQIRPVEWLGEFPRSKFDQDILYALSSPPTVNRVRAPDAEARVQGMLEGEAGLSSSGSEDEDVPTDIEQLAYDQISKYIPAQFKGHGLARLVGAILQAQDYIVRVSPAGPDGGIDIIAGKGALGFEPPRLIVQVKSGDYPVDVGVVRELKGVMGTFGADQVLIVAWGGYTSAAEKEAAREYFRIRLWDAVEIIKQLQDHYDQLPAEIQADLPLKRIWTLVVEEE